MMAESPDASDESWPTAVTVGDGVVPKPGDIVLDPELPYAPEPLVGDGSANPLEDHNIDGEIPEIPLLAMKDHRHTQWSEMLGVGGHLPLRLEIADGTSAVFAIDDGKHHAVIGRVAAVSPSCTYVLVGRIRMDELEGLVDETVAPSAAFSPATELALLGVALVESVASTNVFTVDRYRDASEIPESYAVGRVPVALSSDLDITVD